MNYPFRQAIFNEDIFITKLEKTLYTNVDVLELSKLPSEAKLNGSLINDFVKITNGTTQLTEINDTDIDATTSVGKFCIGSDNVIKLIVTKSKYSDVEAAIKDYMNCIIYYEVQPLELVEGKFIVTVYDRGAIRKKVYLSKVLSLEDLSSFMTTYARDLDLSKNNEPYFEITPLTQIKNI